MNYLASGLEQGFAIGSAARQKKKDREEQERLALLDQQFRKQLQLDDIAAQKQRQDAQLVHDASRQFSQQGWQSGESEKERGFRTGERVGSQGFTGGENEKQRAFTGSQAELDRVAANIRAKNQLDESARQYDTSLPLKGAEVGLQGRAQDWQENPKNPLNMYRLANTPADGFSINGGAPSPIGGPRPIANGAAAAPVTITTPEEYNKLQSGTKFIWNGRAGTKP